MTAIVTGATGFIGRHLVDLLATDREVRCLTRGRPDADARASVSVHHVDYSRSDLGLPNETLHGVTEVFHLAGATEAVSASAFHDANFNVTARLLTALATRGLRPRFIHVSSQAAAGPAPDAEHPKRETDAAAPIEDYGRSKLAAERAVQALGDHMPITIVRPVAVYGPGDRAFLSIFSLAKRGLLVYPGTRRSSVNTVYVADLVKGIVAASRSQPAIGKTYFLGDDTPHPWTEIYAEVYAAVNAANVGAAGQRPLEISLPRGLVRAAGAVGDFVGSMTGSSSLINRSKASLATPKYWLCSSSAARNDFGFATPTSLRDGVRQTYDWYLQHRWL
jgi:nucleoside-diphosphate-sugar epimerase